MTVKEPGRQEYWIDEVLFTDDPRLTEAHRTNAGDRGGSGIITPVRDASGLWTARRDIVLER
jgi:protocatechuate 3,4-dioxygenase beta subunit